MSRVEVPAQFVQQSSISDDEKRAIVGFYGLDPINNWTSNSRGLVNATYELDDRFFLTTNHRRTADEVEAIAEVAHAIDSSISLARPVKGASGFVIELASGNALLTDRIPGIHYVGVEHTDKYPIPSELHPKLAAYFWKLQYDLSITSDTLKDRLPSETITNVGQLPEELPEVALPLVRHLPEDGLPIFKYPDLIHDDIERQNILTVGSEITGLVDLDSLRAGDVLYEYGHFLFNIVLCDPEASLHTVDLYISNLLDAGRIDQGDIPALYGHIYEFCISDIIEFHNLANKPVFAQHTLIDLELLVQQYDKALALAAQFFGIRPS